MSEHSTLVASAERIFHAPKSVTTTTYEQAKERVFAMLREQNRHKPPVERWRSACRVFADLHALNSQEPAREPQATWAQRVMDEDLAQMLTSLHKAGQALDIHTPWQANVDFSAVE